MFNGQSQEQENKTMFVKTGYIFLRYNEVIQNKNV